MIISSKNTSYLYALFLIVFLHNCGKIHNSYDIYNSYPIGTKLTKNIARESTQFIFHKNYIILNINKEFSEFSRTHYLLFFNQSLELVSAYNIPFCGIVNVDENNIYTYDNKPYLKQKYMFRSDLPEDVNVKVLDLFSGGGILSTNLIQNLYFPMENSLHCIMKYKKSEKNYFNQVPNQEHLLDEVKEKNISGNIFNVNFMRLETLSYNKKTKGIMYDQYFFNSAKAKMKFLNKLENKMFSINSEIKDRTTNMR